MNRRISIIALVLLVGLAGACAKSDDVDPAEKAWSDLSEAWNGLETAEEKTALAEDYLARFPDTEHSGRLAARVVYYRGQDLGDPQGAYDTVSAALDQIEDPEQRFEVGMRLFDLSDSVDVDLDIAEVAGALAAVRPLTFDEHEWVAGTGIDLEEWSLAMKYADAAAEIATPEVLRADYPDREFSEAQVAQMVGLRRATSLTNAGWAAYNMGNTELAHDRFTAADEVHCVNYLGVPKTPLYTYWGRTALAEGDFDKAIELLAAETLFSEDSSRAEPYLREAYVAKNGDDEGFDEFLWATRNALARTVDDFTLPDFNGNEINLAEASAGKVTLLAFWFPT
jgi:tetratricopeptide (TPR) repeat protein